jgi:4-hydroxythreonine-4-phosphate dehydrogenase
MSDNTINTATRPIAITMGESAGIGPELVCRLWEKRGEHDLPALIYIGALDSLLTYDPDISYQLIKSPDDVTNVPKGVLPVINIDLTDDIKPGFLNASNSHAVIKAIDLAVDYAMNGIISAIVTSPIHKAALYDIGFSVSGHTEYLAERAGLHHDASVMMLATEGLRVVPITTHIALKDVPKNLTADKIIHAGLVTHTDLKTRFKIDNPRIAVAALNPHAGENGAMGIEEVTHIMPAIHALRDMGIVVTDPQPSDTLFHEEARAAYDAVLCMYHDQALIPLKTLDFWGGVNITLGLPFIRTSPDHGTAIPLAGTGKARVDSMLAAIKTAETLADNKSLDANKTRDA